MGHSVSFEPAWAALSVISPAAPVAVVVGELPRQRRLTRVERSAHNQLVEGGISAASRRS